MSGAMCMDCDWTATGDSADRAADKHTRTEHHATRTWTVPDE